MHCDCGVVFTGDSVTLTGLRARVVYCGRGIPAEIKARVGRVSLLFKGRTITEARVCFLAAALELEAH